MRNLLGLIVIFIICCGCAFSAALDPLYGGTGNSTSTGPDPNFNTITDVAGSTSGTIHWTMPERAAGHKKFIITFGTVTDAGTVLTFPTAFTYTPSITNSTGLTISTFSTTTITIPVSVAATGTITVEGF